MPAFGAEFIFTPEIEAIFIIKSSIYSSSSKIDSSINTIFQTSLNNSIYTIITNVIQTIEKKDNKAIEKTDDPCNDFNTEEQPKDPHGDLGTTEGNIKPIPDLDFDIDHLGKPPIIFKSFNLGIKILENALCIVTKNGIYIYSKDL